MHFFRIVSLPSSVKLLSSTAGHAATKTSMFSLMETFKTKAGIGSISKTKTKKDLFHSCLYFKSEARPRLSASMNLLVLDALIDSAFSVVRFSNGYRISYSLELITP
jgi:hypothetical protein